MKVFSFEKYLAELTELATKLAFELQEYEKLAIEMKKH